MQKYKNCSSFQQGFAEFIDKRPWDFYVTFTTTYEQTLKSARRNMVRFHERANTLSDTTLFFACEPYDVKDGYHVHALIQTEMEYKNVIDCYQITSAGKRQGKWQRVDIKRFRSGEGASKYCAKYITKSLCDWDILLPQKRFFK